MDPAGVIINLERFSHGDLVQPQVNPKKVKVLYQYLLKQAVKLVDKRCHSYENARPILLAIQVLRSKHNVDHCSAVVSCTLQLQC